MTKEILFLITARGGSKGLPGKNLTKIGGLSLVGFKARSARRSKHCSRLIISTEDRDIQTDAATHGVEVPFTRPVELATDTATSDAVILHVMDHIESVEHRHYDAIMVLEPASPFARGQDYDAAVDIFLRHKASVVLGMCQTNVNSIFVGPLGANGKADRIVEKFKDTKDRRRQALEPEFTMNGSLYLVRWEIMRKYGEIYGDPQHTYGYPMDRFHSLEIETSYDLKLAEFFVQNGCVDMANWQ